MAINHKDITSGLGSLGTTDCHMLTEHNRQVLLVCLTCSYAVH